MPYEDKTIICRDCNQSFVFSARDQEFFAQKGFTNTPTRCKDCRNKRKKKEVEATNRPLFKISCKNCGKEGEMATEPRKPDDVMCSQCFYEAFKKQQGDSAALSQPADEPSAAHAE